MSAIKRHAVILPGTVVTLSNNQFVKGLNTLGVVKSLIGLNASNLVSIDPEGLGTLFGAGVTVTTTLNVGTSVSNGLIEITGTNVATPFIRFNNHLAGSVVWRIGSLGSPNNGALNFYDQTSNTFPFTIQANDLVYTNVADQILGSKTTINNGAGASLGTLANAPAAGNPTKWLPYDDNGTMRYIPAW